LKNYFQIGRLVATYGVDGSMVLQHHMGRKTSFEGVQVIFLENLPGSLLPYFVSSWKIKNEREVFIKLEEVNTRESAKTFLQKQVWLAEEDFKKHVSKNAPISMLGYHLIHQGTDLGEVLEIIEQPTQILCRLIYQEKEIFVPINEATLEKIDKKARMVFVNLPDGLLDVYE
jgi:16S rRNA processing protein RimM